MARLRLGLLGLLLLAAFLAWRTAPEVFWTLPAGAEGEALERVEASDCDLEILDLNYTRDTTSGQEGFDLMERIRSIDPTLVFMR